MIKIGIVDLDSSHAPNFTRRINHVNIEEDQWVHGASVVAAYPGYSPAPADAEKKNREYVQTLRDCGVEMVESPEALLGKIDAVMIESDDGRRHSDAAQVFLREGIPTFIDKPMTCSLEEAVALAELAHKHAAPLCSGSSLRYAPEVVEIAERGLVGRVVAADVLTPSRTKIEGVPGMFHYGIHGVETLYAFMGPGCEFVQCTATPFGEVVSARWQDGRLGVVRGYLRGAGGFGFTVIGDKTHCQRMVSEEYIYRELLKRVIGMFEAGEPPVDIHETLEIIAFAEAAVESAKDGSRINVQSGPQAAPKPSF